jgi:hypothetical protein
MKKLKESVLREKHDDLRKALESLIIKSEEIKKIRRIVSEEKALKRLKQDLRKKIEEIEVPELKALKD